MAKKLSADQVRMEDINSFIVSFYDIVQESVDLTDDDLELVMEEIQETLERFFGKPDYRNYN